MTAVDSLREALCWRGPASVNVFVLGAGGAPLPEDAFHLAGLVPDAVLAFPLMEPPPAVARLGLVSYDLDFEDTSLDLHVYARAVLRRVCEGTRAVAWTAFEGAFHYDELLTDRVAPQVYGYCVSGGEPVTAWDLTALRSAEWRSRVAEARAAVEALLSVPRG
ncbi:hypothetical protein [Streptomyces deccanensis]|uniref:hypothetical protein n=1 Tax=Streptomyces deccanensis TaxID=424188 RepID=UPI001EFA855A|nr:hypothetical protein [Streptomyces deccanensis]ULR50295.1 hypothetical protein L3078_13820 [Streptomyces deccanensis]